MHFETPLDLMTTRNGLTWEFLTINEIRNLRQTPEVDREYLEIRYIIQTTLQTLKINLNSVKINLPTRPPLLELVSLSNTGCSKWSSLLKKCFFRPANQVKHERKWEEKLGNRQGVFFWDKCYKLTKSKVFDNKLKWLQQQIVRGSLKTNHVISKFTDVSHLCSFCHMENERILHLFWDCTIVTNFVANVTMELSNRNLCTLNLTKKIFIFGDLKQDASSFSNIITLHMKRFIWISRCKNSPLNFVNFFHWLKRELRILKVCNIENRKFQYFNDANISLFLNAV